MSLTKPIDRPLRATLHQLGLLSPEPERLAEYYSASLGYTFGDSPVGLLGTAPGRRLSITPGPAKTLAYAGYAVAEVADLDALAGRLDIAGAVFRRVDLPGFDLDAVEVTDPDGNHFVFGMAKADAVAADNVTARCPARLQHVVLASTDLARLLAFHTDVVGFTLSDRVVDENGGLRTAFVRCSHEHHSLALFAAAENRLDHHCYEAGDWNLIRDWADHFARQRIALKWGPGRHGPGDNLFLFVHDPDGNWVEISAELEQVAPDRPVGEWPHEERTLNSWGIGFLRS